MYGNCLQSQQPVVFDCLCAFSKFDRNDLLTSAQSHVSVCRTSSSEHGIHAKKKSFLRGSLSVEKKRAQESDREMRRFPFNPFDNSKLNMRISNSRLVKSLGPIV